MTLFDLFDVEDHAIKKIKFEGVEYDAFDFIKKYIIKKSIFSLKHFKVKKIYFSKDNRNVLCVEVIFYNIFWAE